MAPPQVNLNEKPPAEVSQGPGHECSGGSTKEALLWALTNRYNDVANDPLPEKEDSADAAPSAIIVTVDRNAGISAEQRRQRKRCRVVCCASLCFLLVLMLALGTACIVYRMKHKKREWRAWCGTERLPEHVRVNHEHKLIYVKPEHKDANGMEILHEYDRRLIAFKNTTSKTCYLDRLDETFEEGYKRWQGYAVEAHMHNHTMRVFAQKIDIEVVQHIADVHIFEHCGGKEFEYHWVKAVTLEEIHLHPGATYIKV